jgi:hypothetical protein
MEHEIEITNGEGSTFYITYEITPSEARTMEHPGVDGGIEILGASWGKGSTCRLSNEILEDMVRRELESYAEDAAIVNWEDKQHED